MNSVSNSPPIRPEIENSIWHAEAMRNAYNSGYMTGVQNRRNTERKGLYLLIWFNLGLSVGSFLMTFRCWQFVESIMEGLRNAS